jgi:hypothetical protein
MRRRHSGLVKFSANQRREVGVSLLITNSEQDERDRPLCFHWRTIDYERIAALGVSHHKERTGTPPGTPF